MPSATHRLPDAQLLPLQRAYDSTMLSRRIRMVVGFATIIGLIIASGIATEFNLSLLVANIHRFPSYFIRLFHFENGAAAWTNPTEWFWGVLPKYGCRWLWLLWDTVLIAYVGTLIGTIGGFYFSFLASANLGRSSFVVAASRRFLEFCRSVPEIVFALIFVASFGLGAFAGVLALAIHSAGALGKLFSESIENVDMKPVSAATASGATWWQTNRYAVLPQVLPNFTSYALWRFEINVRQASVMGLVGAGGIGQDLIEYIRKFYYTDVSALLVLIIVLVMVIDWLTEKLRHYLLGLQEAR